MDKKIYLIGNAHLDPVWLWRWQEGCGEVLQTFRSAADRLKEYDGFVFTCSSASYYRWVEELDPELFEDIKKLVAEGRWVPVNGWWIQPDCNIPSGESFARQALYSQLFYNEKFGRICRTGYNVDSFGHNGMMPQLLRKAGMDSYVMMRPNKVENSEIPGFLFWWEAPDGSRVLTFRIPEAYCCSGTNDLSRKIEHLEKYISENDHGVMLFYGVGNHGGGPTKGDIEFLIRHMENGKPMTFSSPDEFFKQMRATRCDYPVWRKDMQHHASGCYSATSLIKQLNRKAENALYSSEVFDTLASLVSGFKPSTNTLGEAWKTVCFHQFHDILCGCSLEEAYDDAKYAVGGAIDAAEKTRCAALLHIGKNIDTYLDGISDSVEIPERHNFRKENYPNPVVVYNPHSFDIKMPVWTYSPSKRVCNSKDEDVPFQNIRSSRSCDWHLDTMFVADVPAFGYEVYWLWRLNDDDLTVYENNTAVKAEGLTMENEYIKVTFDNRTGGIKTLINKENGYDYAQNNTLGIPTVIRDEDSDTWGHAVFQYHDIKGVMKLDSIKLEEVGPARAMIRVKYSFNESKLTQEFSLGLGEKMLRVNCRALWQEQFTILKMPFPVRGKGGRVTYEIPCGFIEKECDGDEEPAQRWADIGFTDMDGVRRGLSVINDSKYSYDCIGNELRLTCLRNVIFADHFSDRPESDFHFTDEGLQKFAYAIYLHDGEVADSDVVRQAAMFNVDVPVVPEGFHKGSLERKGGFINVSVPNVVVTAFKFCEDGSGDVILRCYETQGKEDTKAEIRCDLINMNFSVNIYKHEIKTFRVSPDGKVKDINFLEGIVQ